VHYGWHFVLKVYWVCLALPCPVLSAQWCAFGVESAAGSTAQHSPRTLVMKSRRQAAAPSSSAASSQSSSSSSSWSWVQACLPCSSPPRPCAGLHRSSALANSCTQPMQTTLPLSGQHSFESCSWARGGRGGLAGPQGLQAMQISTQLTAWLDQRRSTDTEPHAIPGACTEPSLSPRPGKGAGAWLAAGLPSMQTTSRASQASQPGALKA
jgi:hypothetical protein